MSEATLKLSCEALIKGPHPEGPIVLDLTLRGCAEQSDRILCRSSWSGADLGGCGPAFWQPGRTPWHNSGDILLYRAIYIDAIYVSKIDSGFVGAIW